VFNLTKFSQEEGEGPPTETEFSTDVEQEATDIGQESEEPTEPTETLTGTRLFNALLVGKLQDYYDPGVFQALMAGVSPPHNVDAIEGDVRRLPEIQNTNPEYFQWDQNANRAFQQVKAILDSGGTPVVPLRAASSDEIVKEGQITPEPQENQGPMASEDAFVATYLAPLTGYDHEKNATIETSESARAQILENICPIGEEEANSELEEIQRLDPKLNSQEADQQMRKFYQRWIPPALRRAPQMEQTVMSENTPEGIIKHNLCKFCSQSDDCGKKGMKKEASVAFYGQPYLLYGPTEKRKCPKMSGKNMGDFVSEYICRHHCLDGIVIDDNKTVCGEALWRANVMDKYSRDYVDADGNLVGGYINKRFEVNYNVPEDNNIRLKPGEVRKPSERFWNYEARMQHMRETEGKKRGYRPTTDTSPPFNWSRDVEQNNVEASQEERDRREEASGHQTVQYTNRDQGENQPKKAFNLNAFKEVTASTDETTIITTSAVDTEDPKKKD